MTYNYTRQWMLDSGRELGYPVSLFTKSDLERVCPLIRPTGFCLSFRQYKRHGEFFFSFRVRVFCRCSRLGTCYYEKSFSWRLRHKSLSDQYWLGRCGEGICCCKTLRPPNNSQIKISVMMCATLFVSVVSQNIIFFNMSVIQAEIKFCTHHKYVRQTMSRYSCKYCLSTTVHGCIEIYLV